MNRDREYFLPRLTREFYQGDAVVHWTLTVFDQETGWLTDSFHQRFRELMLHTAAREGLICPTYCLMPDHLHLVWMGLRADTDQRNAMAFLRTHLKPLLAPCRFQPQAHDHVLRDEERKRDAFAKVCSYILNNPVKAGLVTGPAEWKHAGAMVPGYPKLHPAEDKFWPLLWKIHLEARHPDAGKRLLPPRTTS
jgi:putative transposase